MGSSLLIVLLGMLVPVLAAAPFYWAERRTDQQVPESQEAEPDQLAAPED
ncbi:hypothetical protein ABT324_31320 [Saccharopolyspora sp. NPDC000359]